MSTASKTVSEQIRKYKGTFTEDGDVYTVCAEVHWDDRCKNGYNYFSITGTVTGPKDYYCSGCVHEEIAKAIPELAPYIKWHLFDPFGPMHYVANTVYHAGDRDHYGLKKDESRQIRNGRTNQLCWILEQAPDIPRYVDGDAAPDITVTLKYVPWLRIGEGKERDLAAARSTAVWPEATDEELMQEPEALTKQLEARLPALIVEFIKDVESLGFTW